MDSRIAANRRLWNEWARINQESDFYDMAGFRAGQTSLKPIELEEVGDVTAKSLLHLQCHFGQDTLSWARLGAKVTGIDLSPEAIGRAQALAKELGIDARFLCADVLDPKALGEAQFDIVFTSYGALNWLPDLGAWARVIARHLKPGGRFHIVEFHPIISILDEDAREITSGYFDSGEALRLESTASYAGGDHAPIESFGWPHSLAEIVSAARRRPHADQPARVPILRAQLLEVLGRARAGPLRREAPSWQAAAAVLDQRPEIARKESSSACV